MDPITKKISEKPKKTVKKWQIEQWSPAVFSKSGFSEFVKKVPGPILGDYGPNCQDFYQFLPLFF